MALTFTGGVTLQQGQLTSTITPGGFQANAVNFDGTNDYLSRGGGLTGAADGQNALISLWFNALGNDFNTQYIFTNEGTKRFTIRKSGSGKITLFFSDEAAFSTRWSAVGDTIFRSSTNAGWHHLLVAMRFDSSPVGQIYIDDAVETLSAEATAPNEGDIDLTHSNWLIGAEDAGAFPWDGDLAEMYVAFEYMDISDVNNRRLFIDANGFPVDLGSDGSTPTGNIPIVFMSGDTVDWHTNDGSGGGFTENGALTDASSSPSD